MAIEEDPEEHELDALRAVVSFDGRRVLEIGCGDGRLTLRYAHAAASVVAIDPDEESVAALAAERLPNVEARAIAADGIDLAPRSVDVVLFAWSL
jgi:16S rRNA A1518/A1519 N6-dimethyltransferase RsmA/KsgA/DIM1 with predicted DNA glycosylase/AP lyase activity